MVMITLTDTDRYVFGRGNRITVILDLVDSNGNVIDTCKKYVYIARLERWQS